MCGARLYRAFNQSRRSPIVGIVDDVFFLCAMSWDALVNIEPHERLLILQGKLDLCLQLPETYFDDQTGIEALWRTLITNIDGE